jgi:hypothetical protein
MVLQILADAWVSWHEWIALKREGELSNTRATGYLRNLLLGKAWNTWREHHAFVSVAKRVGVGSAASLCLARACTWNVEHQAIQADGDDGVWHMHAWVLLALNFTVHTRSKACTTPHVAWTRMVLCRHCAIW